MKAIRTFAIAFISAVLLAIPALVLASETNGTIARPTIYAWGENFGWINFAPTDESGYAGLHITDTAITGYAWSPQFGWINFAPTNGGVTNTCSGVLGGYAWSPQFGWINMSGVSIGSTGIFSGTAGSSSTAAGRINFSCTNCTVQTDWRQCSLRSSATCGNGVVETGEACDAGSNNGTCPATCSSSCQRNSCPVVVVPNPGIPPTTTPPVAPTTTPIVTPPTTTPATPSSTPDTVTPTTTQPIVGSPSSTPTVSAPTSSHDIELDLAEPIIPSSDDLIGLVHFTGLSPTSTPVDMTFDVIDHAGKVVYSEHTRIHVGDFYKLSKSFTGLGLKPGDYALRLRATHHASTTEVFEKPFTIATSSLRHIVATGGPSCEWCIGRCWLRMTFAEWWHCYWWIVLLIILTLIAWRLTRRREKDEDDEEKKTQPSNPPPPPMPQS